MRAQAKELQRRISLVKSSLPCSYGFSADELVDAVMALGTVTGEGAYPQGRQYVKQHICWCALRACTAASCDSREACVTWSGCNLLPAPCAGLKQLESTDNRAETVKALQWYEEQLRNRCVLGSCCH